VLEHLKNEWVGVTFDVIDASPFPRTCKSATGCVDLIVRAGAPAAAPKPVVAPPPDLAPMPLRHRRRRPERHGGSVPMRVRAQALAITRAALVDALQLRARCVHSSS